MPDQRMDEAVLRHWNRDGLALDLAGAEWEETEPRRRDRRVWIGSHRAIVDLTEQVVSREEWAESARNDYREELVDEYMEAIGRMMSATMGSHVYATFNEGDAFIGQYEDVAPEMPGVMDWWPD